MKNIIKMALTIVKNKGECPSIELVSSTAQLIKAKKHQNSVREDYCVVLGLECRYCTTELAYKKAVDFLILK